MRRQRTVGMVPANVVCADLVIAGRVPELLFACYASPAYQSHRFANTRLLPCVYAGERSEIQKGEHGKAVRKNAILQGRLTRTTSSRIADANVRKSAGKVRFPIQKTPRKEKKGKQK